MMTIILMLLFIGWMSMQKYKKIERTVYGINDIGERMDMLNNATTHKAVAITTYSLAMMMLLIKLLTI
jgi:hypothetical protein